MNLDAINLLGRFLEIPLFSLQNNSKKALFKGL